MRTRLLPAATALLSITTTVHAQSIFPLWDDIFRPQDQVPPFDVIPEASIPGPKIVYDDRVFFAALRPTWGNELCWTDASLGDYPYRTLPKGHDDILPGPLPASSYPADFVLFCDRLFFVADRMIEGVLHERVLHTIGPSTGDTVATYWEVRQGQHVFDNISDLTLHKGQLWFTADGVSPWYQQPGGGGGHGRHLWRIRRDLSTGLCVNQMVFIESPRPVRTPYVHEIESAGKVIAVCLSRNGGLPDNHPQIWTTNGRTASASLAVDGLVAAHELTYEPVSRQLMFAANPLAELPVYLYRSDLLSVAGVEQLTDDTPFGFGPTSPAGLFAAGGFVYCSGWSPDAGREPWRTQGDPLNTEQVADLNDGPASSAPFDFERKDDFVFYLTAGTDGFADGLFRSRISTNETIDLDRMGNPDDLTLLEDDLFYFAGDIGSGPGALGNEVWVSDGTIVGTRPCWDANPGGASSDPNHFVYYDGLVLFTGDEVTIARELAIVPYGVCGL